MTELAMGTKVFKRTEKLRRLLDSVPPADVSTVYVADDGNRQDRDHLYARDYPFNLEVLEMEYNAGVSRGRNRVVEEADEEVILLVDSDHTVPADVGTLAAQLKAQPDVGGIAGSLIEPDIARLYQPACDLAEHDGGLIKSSRLKRKEVEYIAGHPFVPFDFIPNAGIFRRACLKAYSWDSEFVNHKEHIDFFVGHWKQTDWQFGVCPTVFFEHYPGGDDAYVNHRFDEDAFREQGQYFHEKWGYDFLKSPHGHWFDTHKVSSKPIPPRELDQELPLTPSEALESYPEKEPTPLPLRAYRYYRNEGAFALAKKAWEYV